jgi:formiminotetrahydrofolate cyclodeaminase
VPAFLEAIAREAPTPGGGSVSAVAGAMAAALVEMAARYARDWDGAATTAQRAHALRERLAELAVADAEAFEAVLAAEPDERAAALEYATEVPRWIAEAADEIAELAARVGAQGNRNLEGDAFVARELAGAAGRAAQRLVEINREAARTPTPQPTSGG